MTLSIDLPDEQTATLKAKAKTQGLSAEQYARQILGDELTAGTRPRRISSTIRQIWKDVPDEVRAKLPPDGASQVDHYVYGLPKRDQ